MPKINRFNGNLPAFAQNALGFERTIFGSESQSNDLTAQFNADFTRGWGIVSSTENPSREDFNAVLFTLSQTLAYLHQMGVPEWNAAQEYYVNSITTDAGAIYVSRNTNTNTRPSTNAAAWHRLVDAGNYQALFDTAFNGKTTTFTRGLLTQSTADNARTALGLGSLATQSTVSNSNWSGTDLSIANGGTGASTAAAAAANLGVPQVGTASNQVRNNSQLDARYIPQSGANYDIYPGGIVHMYLSTSAINPDSTQTVIFPFAVSSLRGHPQVSIRNSATGNDDIFARLISASTTSVTVRAELTEGGTVAGTRFIDILVIGKL